MVYKLYCTVYTPAAQSRSPLKGHANNEDRNREQIKSRTAHSVTAFSLGNSRTWCKKAAGQVIVNPASGGDLVYQIYERTSTVFFLGLSVARTSKVPVYTQSYFKDKAAGVSRGPVFPGDAKFLLFLTTGRPPGIPSFFCKTQQK